MDEYESTRRIFLRKLGLTVGGVALAGAAKSAKIVEEKIHFPLTPDQKEFMKKYDEWMDSFIEVIHQRKTHPDDLEINMRLMKLSEKAEAWQPQVNEFMKDENFARHYMIATEKMTNSIE